MLGGPLHVCFGDESIQVLCSSFESGCLVFFFLVVELGEVLHEPGLPVRPKEVAFYLGNGSLLSRGGSDQICALQCSPRRWYRLHQAGGRPRLSWVLGDGWGGPC